MKNIELTKRLMALLGATTIVLTMNGCNSSKKKEDNKEPITTTTVSTLDSNNTEIELTTTLPQTTCLETTTVTAGTTTTTTDNITTSATTFKTSTTKPSIPTTTKKKTTTTTNKPTTGTTKTTTTTPTTVPTSVDKLTQSNINNIEAIDWLAQRPYRNIFYVESEALFVRLSYSYEGEYYTCDKDEFRFFIAMLNEQYMEDETLVEMFGDKSIEDFNRYYRVWDCLYNAVYNLGGETYFENVVVDPNMAKFLTRIESEAKLPVDKRNDEEYLDFVKKYYEGTNPLINYNDNILVDNYVVDALGRVAKDTKNFELFELYHDHKWDSAPFLEYATSEEGFYSKIKSKQLTK